jgi:hypothetical protein
MPENPELNALPGRGIACGDPHRLSLSFRKRIAASDAPNLITSPSYFSIFRKELGTYRLQEKKELAFYSILSVIELTRLNSTVRSVKI